MSDTWTFEQTQESIIQHQRAAMNKLAGMFTAQRSALDAVWLERDRMAVHLLAARDLLAQVKAERDAHLLQVARLEMQLQAKQDALELVIRENTANVAALARYKAALERISDGAVQPYARIATRALHPEPANG